ncbi:MAG TPA: diaminobutyrate acetyltransferase [Steroidobacteraceae bacterium]|nr:diaminobutyrate acetyltransferase [Steroidobacteraceae bacterium]
MKRTDSTRTVGSEPAVQIRAPAARDGAAVHSLIARCPPLDANSLYCNLLQCTHWADTSVLAERNGRIVGFTSGYLIPGRDDTLFVWQVAVATQARGIGLASRMLDALLEREACQHVTHLETTITPDNAGSWALFRRFAERRGAQLEEAPMFDRERHFGGGHDTEVLARIGPFAPSGHQELNTHTRKSA